MKNRELVEFGSSKEKIERGTRKISATISGESIEIWRTKLNPSTHT